MARIRSVHPGLFTDEAFMTASPVARLFFIGLWCEAHDDGVFEWKPLTLKVRLLPADEADPATILDELARLNFVTRFSYRGKQLGVIRNFQKYQRPQKAKPSGLLPAEYVPYATVGNPPLESLPDGYGIDTVALSSGEEDGVGVGEEKEEEAAAQAPAAAAARWGTDEIGGWLRPLVGDMPVVVDPDTRPIGLLLGEGLLREDVEAGIAACVGKARRKPRCWADFEMWIRRSAKDRLAASPAAIVARHTPPPVAPKAHTPAHMRRIAIDFFRGELRQGGPAALNPAHPDCIIPAAILDEARAAVEQERGALMAPRAAA